MATPSTIDYPFPPNITSVPTPTAGVQEAFTADAQAYPYLVWKCRAYDEWETGLARQPLAADDSAGKVACKIVKLGAAYGRRVVRFTASRLGAWPVVPDSATDDPNLRLLKAQVVRSTPAPTGDAADRVFTVRGRYVYALLTPVFPADGFPAGSPPYSTVPKESNVLGPAQFSKRIV